jgi:hypothetical protein
MGKQTPKPYKKPEVNPVFSSFEIIQPKRGDKNKNRKSE